MPPGSVAMAAAQANQADIRAWRPAQPWSDRRGFRGGAAWQDQYSGIWSQHNRGPTRAFPGTYSGGISRKVGMCPVATGTDGGPYETPAAFADSLASNPGSPGQAAWDVRRPTSLPIRPHCPHGPGRRPATASPGRPRPKGPGVNERDAPRLRVRAGSRYLRASNCLEFQPGLCSNRPGSCQHNVSSGAGFRRVGLPRGRPGLALDDPVPPFLNIFYMATTPATVTCWTSAPNW